MKLGGASFELLFHALVGQLEVGRSAVVETAFIPEYHNARFRSLRDRYPFTAVQVYCTAEAEVLFERFIGRAASGERHPGHVDQQSMSRERFLEMLEARRYGKLETGDRSSGDLYLEIDTTDVATVDVDALIATIRDHVDQP